jgi:hypothetical protein
MTTNLQEFLAMSTLVTASTIFVAGFRYMIASWEKSSEEEIRRRQPEWDALAAKVKSNKTSNRKN